MHPSLRFALRRFAVGALILLAVSLLVFVGCEILPGDVAQVALGQFATPESIRALHQQFGLDRPAPLRYLEWLIGILHGDWGMSMGTKVPVAQLLGERLANTAMLAGATTIVAIPLALALGLLMALRAGSRFDRAASVVVLALSATPEFLIGTLAVMLFSVHLNWLPAVAQVTFGGGWAALARSLLLPVITLSIVVAAQIARMTRATIVNLLDLPFIEMATLKGVPRRRIILVHALINAVGPIANVVALNIAYLVSGIVVVETIFAFPGVARLMVDAVQARDLPVVQACAMLFCFAYVVLILAADLLAVLFNPRLRRGIHPDGSAG
ncbi:MAG TPA: ABC transporter permease [Stellaceae bacterium]|nr:ABC transporter permease [Stellaceae bacterium]